LDGGSTGYLVSVKMKSPGTLPPLKSRVSVFPDTQYLTDAGAPASAAPPSEDEVMISDVPLTV
jgi:hypothetical protein